jgi:hypothetical protein
MGRISRCRQSDRDSVRLAGVTSQIERLLGVKPKPPAPPATPEHIRKMTPREYDRWRHEVFDHPESRWQRIERMGWCSGLFGFVILCAIITLLAVFWHDL